MREPKTTLLGDASGSRGGLLRRMALGLILLAVGAITVFAQSPADSQQNQPIQTAARARVPVPSAAQRLPNTSAGSALQSLVSFEDGQLSINATDVSLADVLFAVRGATGADIDIPLNASSEHVTAHLGPGPARKILADLLGWSTFDYIIQGSDDDPLAVQSITLMARSRSTGTPGVIAPAGAPRETFTPKPEPEPPLPATADVAVVEPHLDQPASGAAPADASDSAAALPLKVQQPTTMPWNGGAPISSTSPSDMIQQLQQMYQQRRQMQEQQNQTTGQRTP